MSKKSELIQDLINDLNDSIDYVVLRGYESIPYNTTGDIDLLISKSSFNSFCNIIESLKSKHNLNELKRINRNYVYMFRLFHVELNENYGLKIDIHFEESYLGAEYLSSKEILSKSTFYNDTKIPSYEHQVIFNYLQPILGMGYLPDKRKKRILNQLNKCSFEKLKSELIHLFSKKASKFLIKIFTEKKMILSKYEILYIRSCILFKSLEKPIKLLKNFTKTIYRRIFYKFNPPGLFIVFMGPDGAGKSTAISSFIKVLKQFVINDGSELLAWRPHYLRRLSEYKSKPNPLDNASKQLKIDNIPSKFSSFFRYMYYFMDYILGFYFKYRKVLTNEGYIIFDRYFYDYLIQPSYRSFINLPYFIKSSVSIFIPQPDLIIYFQSDPETLHSRKQEETLNELQELVTLYDDYISNNKKIKVLNANLSKERVLLQLLNFFRTNYEK